MLKIMVPRMLEEVLLAHLWMNFGPHLIRIQRENWKGLRLSKAQQYKIVDLPSSLVYAEYRIHLR
jgi:hypothetical protein